MLRPSPAAVWGKIVTYRHIFETMHKDWCYAPGTSGLDRKDSYSAFGHQRG
jgi:hypothetical protein